MAPSNLSPRIALVTGNINLGGATTFLINLARELASRDIPHLVLSMQPSQDLWEDFQIGGINIQIQPPSKQIFEDRIAAACETLRDFQPTHAIGCLGPISFEVVGNLPLGIRKFAMVQSDDPAVYRAIQPFGSVLDATVGVSRRACEVLKNTLGLEHLPAEYQPYGIPVPVEAPTRTANINHEDPIRILYLGRIDREQKRAHLFPQILERLKQSGRPFVWTLVGEGPMREELSRSMQTGRSDQQVIFAGAVPYSKVPGYLSQQDVFLLASNYEGLPLSLLEAMAHGIVPVVSDLQSGIRDVVSSDCGIRVPTEDFDGYARGILDLEADRARLADFSTRGAARVRDEFSCRAMCDRWVAMLEFYPCENPVRWPAKIPIGRPLSTGKQRRFHPALRPLRRLAAFFR